MTTQSSHGITRRPAAATGQFRALQRRAALAAFFLLAVSLHLALLCLPISRSDSRPQVTSTPLNIFLAPAVQKHFIPVPNEIPVETRPADKQLSPGASADKPAPEFARTGQHDNTAEADRKDTAVAPTTARLLLQAAELKLPKVLTPSLTLGVYAPRTLPTHLSKPVLAAEETLFAAVWLPAQQQVLDQWQDPDGGIRAVMRLPNGQTVCGSQHPWDPLNPLFQPVAMYHECGGGGRRAR